MGLDGNDIWRPDADHVGNAQITALMRRLGVEDFDAFYDLSIDEPERYWREVVDFCGIRFSRPYETWRDLSRGKPFPSWFVGGELNWVDTILDNEEAGTASRWSARPRAARPASSPMRSLPTRCAASPPACWRWDSARATGSAC